jgi:hypothetical protein
VGFPLGLPLVFFLISGTTAPGAMVSVERAQGWSLQLRPTPPKRVTPRGSLQRH